MNWNMYKLNDAEHMQYLMPIYGWISHIMSVTNYEATITSCELSNHNEVCKIKEETWQEIDWKLQHKQKKGKCKCAGNTGGI